MSFYYIQLPTNSANPAIPRVSVEVVPSIILPITTYNPSPSYLHSPQKFVLWHQLSIDNIP